ncbi:pentatricopeptide repeat-containing protein At3g16610 [Typha angustifolia]|uniref:pentatricopeptide repeat-containing protein At3g16610 n=1 Tax=Typha angustifolia TaxID=59011 RepID=UPI003C2F821C
MRILPLNGFLLVAYCKSLYSSLHYFSNLRTKSKPNHRILTEASNIEFRDKRDEVDAYCDLLESCIRSKSLAEGKKIHQRILRSDAHITSSRLLEKIARVYVACGEIGLARDVFDKILQPTTFLWNAMIRAYSWNGPYDRAIDLYHKMVDSGVESNKFTFPFVLKACSSLVALEEGIEIHNHARRLGLDTDLFVSTALIDMYMKCRCLDDSYKLFCEMPTRDVVAWNAMIAGFALYGIYEDTINFVLEMQREGKTPNPSTLVAMLPVVGQQKSLRQGKSIHGFSVRRCFDGKDVLLGTALLDMYAKCDHLSYACRIFDGMTVRNEVTWSALIGGYVLIDKMEEALELFNQMMLEGSSTVSPTSVASVLRACARLGDLVRGQEMHTFLVKSGFLSDITAANSLLSMYAKAGSIDDAVKFFEEMDAKDTVSYSALISGCVQNGNAEEAFFVFRKMQLSNTEPDAATMVGVIPACSHLAALQHGKCSHGHVIVRGLTSDTSICNALIDMYAKCGRIDLARIVFDKMMNRDVVSWNAVIAGYGIHGLGSESISVFSSMESAGVIPDDITFICLISACSHSGLVNDGKHCFHVMTRIYGIKPRMEHYICMVDLLGRGGFLNEAHDFICNMPFKPDVRVWGALLGACRVHKNIELGEEVSKMIQMLGPEGTGNFVLLSNIYSAAGKFDEAAQVRIMQRVKGFKKSPGCSWIEIKGSLHAFVGGDRSHPQSSIIYHELENLFVDIRKLGYQADTSFALHDVEKEEKEHALLYHSEKLAIAFGVLSLRNDQTIFITKNLRVCGDCHTAIKFITLATSRSIIVRDSNRFHHFQNGICSCGDFW